jgi:8-oxo-dGTP pyrophosphatase MutT (NUDIX family)
MIQLLQQKLLTHLPGLATQLLMAPPTRNASHLVVPNHAKLGGVMIVLFLKNNEWHVLLMRRTEDKGKHSGQISFPGGKYDNTDNTITYTAIRELEEEMGLTINDYTIIGSLSSLYIPPSNFLISPIVAYTKNAFILNPSQAEVAEVLEIPLKKLFAAATKTMGNTYSSFDNTQTILTPMYTLDDSINIWGATAMVLRELEELVIDLL